MLLSYPCKAYEVIFSFGQEMEQTSGKRKLGQDRKQERTRLSAILATMTLTAAQRQRQQLTWDRCYGRA